MTQFISKEKEEAVYSVRIVCGLLFVLFSITYLCVQTPLLEALQYVLSEGKTSYAMWWGALIITFVLMLLQVLVSFLSKWVSYLHALSYLPSFLCLAFLTDHHRELYQMEMPDHWKMLCGSVLFFYVVGAFVNRRWRSMWNSFYLFKGETIRCASNVFLMLLLSVGTLSLAQMDESFYSELSFESQVRAGRPNRALQVGLKHGITGRNLTALRAYQLSRAEQLGDSLFVYPQRYGSEGLLLQEGPRATYLTAEELYAYLGAERLPRESARHYLARLCHTETGTHPALDYYLCALLLDRELDLFVQELEAYYEIDENLPLHYKEALVLYAETHPHYLLPFPADDLIAAYESNEPSSARYWSYYPL